MNINGRPYRTIWPSSDGISIEIIDQSRLPHEFVTLRLDSCDEVAAAIRDMTLRGAPLIGAAAAYGIALAMQADPSDTNLERAHGSLLATRPTAVNLRWALDGLVHLLAPLSHAQRTSAAFTKAAEICDGEVAICRAIGEHGLPLIEGIWRRRGKTGVVNLLTHCNAGWLAGVDIGMATAPIYLAHDAGIPVHVWVDETRPRNQGAALTAWELLNHGVPHTVISDNAGGHLMQIGKVDLCIVGTDRTTANGDVCNKIGTYLKALAAFDNNVPFYAAVPSSSIDWMIADGLSQIPIEKRDATEVTWVRGHDAEGKWNAVRITPPGSPAANYGFDVTPARLVTGLITERGISAATHAGLAVLFPEIPERAKPREISP